MSAIGQKKSSPALFLILLGLLLVVTDQVIKILVRTHLSIGEGFPVIGSWFRILFIENEGMAFGMSFGGPVGKLLLSLFRIGLSGLLIWWISRLLKNPLTPKGVLVGLTLITAGAVGNLIDCMFYGILFDYAPFLYGRVVDMLYFPLIDTTWPQWLPLIGGKAFRFFEPVFNFADSCVTVGAFYLILFQYRFFAETTKKDEKKA